MDKGTPERASENRGAAPLAIIGIGCLFPQADGLDAYWWNITRGIDTITEVPETHWRPEDYLDRDPKAADRTYAARGGFLSPVDFDPLEFGIAPKDLEAIDTTQLLGLVVAKSALQDAGYWQDADFDRDRVSVLLGVTGTLEMVIPLGARLGHPKWRRALQDAGVEDAVAEDVVQRISDSYVGWQENSFPGLLGNVVAGRIANRLDLGGTNCVVDAACASSLSALHLASLELTSGRSDMVVTGGLDTFNDIFMYMCFSKTPALSPTGDAKPFDAETDGTILGEGLGVLIIKRLEDAERDGDRIYATIRSMGTSSDGRGNAVYAPTALGQSKALREAYRHAGFGPDTIELVEAHGTGTKVGDATEIAGLMEVYKASGGNGSWCALGSVKSQIGHTKAAAGAAGLIKAALALHHKVLPPTIKVKKPIEPLADGESPFYLNTECRPWMARATHPRRAGVSSFGFGGSNFHCVLEEHQAEKQRVDWDTQVQILPFSAHQLDGLRRELAEWPTALSWPEFRAKAGRARRSFDSSREHRLILVVERGGTACDELIAQALRMLEASPDKHDWSTPDGTVYGRGAIGGQLAFLFPGQGSQHIGMLRDLACRFPEFQNALAEAERTFGDGEELPHGQRLTDFIYPHSLFEERDRLEGETALQATEVAQPAIGAVSVGALKVLLSFGVTPDAAAGHSYGELTALHAAGVFSEADLFALSRMRGRLMAEGDGDRGAMLAVQAKVEELEALLVERGLALMIANRNTPEQAVLSGCTGEIERATQILSEENIKHKRLPVAAAFHSPLVADAQTPFRSALDDFSFHTPQFPVFANSTAEIYPGSPEKIRELLAGQLARPVEFVSEIEHLYGAGVRTFVEVGPGARLTGLVRSILQGREHAAIPIEASSGARPGISDLARALAQIAALGHSVALMNWDPDAESIDDGAENRRPGMTVPLCGANYVHPKPPRPPREKEGSAGGAKEQAPAGRPGAPEPTTAARPIAAASSLASIPSPAPLAPLPASEGSAPQPAAHPRTPQGKDALLDALRVTQENLLALKRHQEQTAELHRQFLEGQRAMQQSFQALIDQQQRLLEINLGMEPQRSAPTPRAEPVPTGPAPARFFSSPPDIPAMEPPATEAASATAPAAAPTSGIAASDLESGLLAIVSEKTGYPAEMLNVDMEMDADLGIDSIKRVEILAACQERYPELPEVKSEHLGELRTLRDVLDLLVKLSVGSATTVPAPAEPPSDAGRQEMSATLLQVVSEKTGYPAEMLDLDMELDADLGIDSIKRVEILSALEGQLPGMPEVRSEHLAAFQNLRQVVEFLASPSADAEQAEGPDDGAAEVVEPAPDEAPSPAYTERVGSPFDSIQRSAVRSVPLNGPAERESFTLTDGAEIWICDDGTDLAPALSEGLNKLGYRPQIVDLAGSAELPRPSALEGLVVLSPPSAANDQFLKHAFKAIQLSGPALRRAGEAREACLVTVSRLDGEFGLNGLHPRNDPASGGLAGLTKTAAHEWPEVNCKALDVTADLKDRQQAVEAILDEMFRPSPIEVGVSNHGRHTLEMAPSPLSQSAGPLPLERGDVVVVTGGARGITARAALALAQAFQPTLVLLGRSREPHPEPGWLRGLSAEPEIKRAILGQLAGDATPMKVAEEYRAVLANRELNENLAKMEAAGARVLYRSVDVRDPAAVETVLRAVRQEAGPVRGLIHGAGVLADRLIEEKTEEQFDLVYRTKVSGFRFLLKALEEEDLKVLVTFSSSTARFGRKGQVDYAVANEVLNKLAQQQARLRPNCRVRSINWGPWEGGMVTPALKKIFESEGVGLISPDAGADYLVREISRGPGQPVEIVVLGTNGNAGARVEAPPSGDLELALERSVSPDDHPVLRSHVIGGHAVLPAALIVEWLGHAALHGNPGLAFHGFDGLRVLSGVKFDGATPQALRVLAGKAQRNGEQYTVPVELRSRQPDGSDVLHARADVVLMERLPQDVPNPDLLELTDASGPTTEVYGQGALFHGEDLHGIERVEACSTGGIIAQVAPAPRPADWMEHPPRGTWLADPLALDCSFQMMILWSRHEHGFGSLPCSVGSYRQYQRRFDRRGTRIVARAKAHSAHRALADIEFLNREGKLVARMSDCECVVDQALNDAFRANQLPDEVAHRR